MGSATRPAASGLFCCAGTFVVRLFFLASRLANKAEHAVDLIGCRRLPASLRADSSLADSSLALGALNRGSENGGPSCSHRADLSFLPREEQQGRALQTFLQRRKNGSSSLVPRPAPYWLWHSEPSRSFASKVRLRGITHKAESNSNCLGQATVVLVRWTFQPVAALIVRHVSSGDLEISGNSIHFSRKAAFGRMVSTCTRPGRAARWGRGAPGEFAGFLCPGLRPGPVLRVLKGLRSL